MIARALSGDCGRQDFVGDWFVRKIVKVQQTRKFARSGPKSIGYVNISRIEEPTEVAV
jgi:hypothetical protein